MDFLIMTARRMGNVETDQELNGVARVSTTARPLHGSGNYQTLAT
jgi:hypothetical protein